MYFVDRLSLGKQFATRYPTLRSGETIIICLKSASLLTVISMAIEMRAWIYLLEYEVIRDPRDESKILGAVTFEGEFCLNPDVSEYEFEGIKMDFYGMLEDRKREAMQRLNSRLTEDNAPFDKHVLNGRNIILVGDILGSAIELEIVSSIMKPLRPASVYGCVGNASIEISDYMHINTDDSNILDILPYLMDDNHYFERPDGYSEQEKKQLARNIQTYWVTS